MAAEIQTHGEQRVARFRQREISRHVRLRTGMRLDVGVLGAEQLFRPVDGELLDDVHAFAAAVVTLAGIAFGVLVGEHRAGGFENRRRDKILAGDQFDVLLLALQLALDGIENCRVGLRQSGGSFCNHRGMIHFLHAPLVAASFKRGRQPDFEQRFGLVVINLQAGQNDDVGVVVFAAQPGGMLVVDQRGACADETVGGDRHADAAFADQDAAVEVAGHNLARDHKRVIRIIHRLGRVRAEIGELIAMLREPVLEHFLHLDAAMVGRDGHPARCGDRRRGLGLRYKFNDARQRRADLVARAPVDFDRLADGIGDVFADDLGVLEFPEQKCFLGGHGKNCLNGVLLLPGHRENEIRLFDQRHAQRLAVMLRDVDAEFGHHIDGGIGRGLPVERAEAGGEHAHAGIALERVAQ